MNPRFIIQVLLVATATIAYPSDYEPDYEMMAIDETPITLNKRSLHSDFGTTLTGVEKITKRSLKSDTSPLFDMERISKRSLDDVDGFEDGNREKRWAFLPKFARKRQRRSLDDVPAEDGESRERRWAFLPKFARRRQRRAVDEELVDESGESREKRWAFLPKFARRRQRRSIDDAADDDDGGEKRVRRFVFRPNFHRRHSRDAGDGDDLAGGVYLPF